MRMETHVREEELSRENSMISKKARKRAEKQWHSSQAFLLEVKDLNYLQQLQ